MVDRRADLTMDEECMFQVSAANLLEKLTPHLNPWAVRRWLKNNLLFEEAMREVLRSKGADLDCDLPIITINPAAPLPLVERYTQFNELTFESDMDYPVGEFEFELIPFNKSGETSIPTSVLVERAKELGAYCGQRHGEALLANQLAIPWEWQGNDILLPGTVFKNKFGHLEILGLRVFGRSGWGFDRVHLGGHVLAHYRLLHPTRKLTGNI